MIRKFYDVILDLQSTGGNHKPITGEDVAALLQGIHHHRYNEPGNPELDDADIIYYEEDLLPVLEALGLPAPIWGKSMSLEEWKKQRSKS